MEEEPADMAVERVELVEVVSDLAADLGMVEVRDLEEDQDTDTQEEFQVAFQVVGAVPVVVDILEEVE